MYRNSEGYSDPTAGAAMSTVMREYHRQQRARRPKTQTKKKSKAESWKGSPKVYVCSAYAGDVEQNRKATIRYCRFVIDRGRIPVASHLMYPQILNDNIRDERELGPVFGLELLAACDEIWVFGSSVSQGMEREIQEARKLGKPLSYIGDLR